MNRDKVIIVLKNYVGKKADEQTRAQIGVEQARLRLEIAMRNLSKAKQLQDDIHAAILRE